jgi:three-Cys-motif partner protein
MVATTTDQHFAEYRLNTKIKHEILTKYLRAYLFALSHAADAVHYIDGFAGRGYYGKSEPGSPLRALEILGKQDKLPYCASFVEVSEPDYADLQEAVSGYRPIGKLLETPLVLRGEFADHIDSVLDRRVLSRYRRVATFAFIDPCKVRGVRLADIKKVLQRPYGECLVFCNYDGMVRWLGAVASGASDGEGLRDFLGDDETLKRAVDLVQATKNPKEKETGLLGIFLSACRTHSGASHLLPFRFNAQDAQRTSHYLVHFSRHGLAFKIMKGVMSALSSVREPEKFEFLGQSDIGDQADLFRPAPSTKAEEAILALLANGPSPLTVILDEWVQRPDDFFSETHYRKILLDMEERGRIEVLKEDGETLLLRADRRMINGKSTLPKQLWIRKRADVEG